MVELMKGINKLEYKFAEDQVVYVYPVSGKYMKVFIKLINKLSALDAKKLSEQEYMTEFLNILEDSDLDSLVDLVKASISVGNKGFKEDELDYFVSNHFIKLMPLVISVNMPNM